jgi:hypothetical protein
MLERRIEERSRLLSMGAKESKDPSPMKQLTDNIYSRFNFKEGGEPENEGDGKWDTKDSIINQIYQDYRN